jgi:uncharacterized membrane protein
MTEREYQQEHEVVREQVAVPNRHDVYHEQAVGARPAAPRGAAREIVQEHISGPAGDQVVRRERVRVPSEAARQAVTATRIQQVITFIFGMLVALLAIRFALLLLGANPASGFVQLIYGLTALFVAPFQGMFSEPAVGASLIEWAAIVAIMIYSLVAYGLNRLVDLIYRAAPAADGDS